MRIRSCPETSVGNYHSMLREIHKQHRSQIYENEEIGFTSCVLNCLVYHIILTGNRISYTFMLT